MVRFVVVLVTAIVLCAASCWDWDALDCGRLHTCPDGFFADLGSPD